MAKKKGVSLNPNDFVSGGLIDDVDCTFENVKFEMYDYNGKVSPANPSLGIDIRYGDAEDDKTRQYWSAGSHKDWAASDDGSMLVSVGQATALRKSTNLFNLLKSLCECGFQSDELDEGVVTCLEGLKCHVMRIPAPKRAGLQKGARVNTATGEAFTDTILVVSQIYGGPESEKQEAVSKNEKAADVEAEAVAALKKLLDEKGSIAKKDLPTTLFAKLPDTPNRNPIMTLVFKDEFLAAHFNVVDGNIFPK